MPSYRKYSQNIPVGEGRAISSYGEKKQEEKRGVEEDKS